MIKTYRLTPLEFLAAGGMAFPVFFGVTHFFPGFKARIDNVPILMIVYYMVVGFIVYITIHIIPTKSATVIGVCGWLMIPVTLFLVA
jgi:hypothetical protein